jgi:hypothetical protein
MKTIKTRTSILKKKLMLYSGLHILRPVTSIIQIEYKISKKKCKCLTRKIDAKLSIETGTSIKQVVFNKLGQVRILHADRFENTFVFFKS